jgi:hypothetical protein
MENSKTPRKYSTEWYDTFSFDQDTRYYGVFMKSKDEARHIMIDPIRYQKKFHVSDAEIKENMKEVMSKRDGPLFRPAKKGYFDYNINIVKHELAKIERHWEKDIKPLITRILSEICGKQFFSGDGYNDELLHSGIIDHEEAAERATMKTQLSNSLAEFKKNELYASLYSMYFHQLASQIEGVILKILTRNDYKEETFSRKQFYKFRPNLEEEVYGLKGHTEFDKLYTIWCFLKHNSFSMYKALKEKFPAVMKEEAYEYKKAAYEQGETAIYEIMRVKFPAILKTEAYGLGDYAVYVALQTKCPEALKPEVLKSEVYEQGVMAMYKALLSRFPELQKEVCTQGEIEIYTALLTKFPDLQYEQREMVRRNALRNKGFPCEIFEQGEMTWRFVEFSDDLIQSILTGIGHFLIEYCRLVFGENELEASWNSEEHFYTNAMCVIREEQDPMGIHQWWAN